MTISKSGINFIKYFESYRAVAYKDSAGIYTIGYGTIKWLDGSPVKRGDKISRSTADILISKDLNIRSEYVSALLGKPKVNQNQFDALVSFAYNVGLSGLGSSTLLKRVKKNTEDITIKDAFLMWNKITIDGKLVKSNGLTRRRKAEAELYFKI